MKNKKIYVPLAVDILHSAHINILKKAKKYGKVIVGLLTDSAISEYKKFPLIDYKERYNTLKGIKFVDQIVEQKIGIILKILGNINLIILYMVMIGK